MWTERSRQGRSSRWAALVLATLGSAFLAWQVVKVGAVEALGSSPAAALIAPDDPRVRLRLASAELNRGVAAPTPATLQRAQAALARLPLSETPFVLESVAALVARDASRGEQLLEEARRRNPRARLPRLLLLDRYMRTGRMTEAAVEMGTLGSLMPRATEILVPELARLAQDPNSIKSLEHALRVQPGFRNALLEHLAASGANPDLIVRLAQNVPAARRGDDREWQRKLVGRLVERGEIGRAYRLWRTVSAPQAPEAKAGVYDPKFASLPGLPPFAWEFPSAAAGTAEMAKGGGLEVEFYGRESGELARQVLTLPAGSYRIHSEAEGSAAAEGSSLAWTVRCLSPDQEIARLPVAAAPGAAKRSTGAFTVPANCNAQWIRLLGIAAEFPKPLYITFRTVDIEAVQ